MLTTVSLIFNVVLVIFILIRMQIFLAQRRRLNNITDIVSTLLKDSKTEIWCHDLQTNTIAYAQEDYSFKHRMNFDDHLLIKPEEDRIRCFEHIQKMMNDPSIRSAQLHYRFIDPSLDEGYRYVTAMVVPVWKDGKITKFYAIESDISHYIKIKHNLERQVQDAIEANRNKSLFVANVPHYIRTPLNSVIGFAQLLCDDLSQEERQELYPLMKMSSLQLLNLINDILDFSKLEAGKMEFCPVKLNLREFIPDLIKTFEQQKKEGVNIILNAPEETIEIYFDRQRLSQMINNFVSNAIKFTEKGDIVVTYTYDETNGLYLEVKDSGMGIKDEDKPTIFQQYTRPHSSIQGTGLGLSICKAIVDTMDGDIGFHSVYGQGATFWFSLPQKSLVKPEEKLS